VQLLNKLEEKQKLLDLIYRELEREKKNSTEFTPAPNEYRIALIQVAERISTELSHEERILKQFEILSKKYDGLQVKFNALNKSPFSRLTYFSWDIYNKIRYNKKFQHQQ
jgi:hypothetical protein